ncbi:MAG: Na(+)-translocating NADH-quinone reductase subunit A [Planctomycetota bacterium]
MPITRVRKGLDVPLAGGSTSTEIVPGPAMRHVALLPADSVGLKIRLLVREGDKVKRGTPLYQDRREEQVVYSAPAAGEVAKIHRGDKRKVLSVVIRVDDSEQQESFPPLTPATATREQVRDWLAKTGFWPCLRQRPFDKVALFADTPHSLFITAADTNPLAPSPKAILAGHEEAFRQGAIALAKLSGGKTFITSARGEQSPAFQVPGTEHHEFAGPHPAGNVGIHISLLDPVGAAKRVWHIGYQDVLAIGQLLTTGKYPVERVLALVGPGVKAPRWVRTRRGADLAELLHDNIAVANPRVVSGSALSGTISPPGTATGYAGRYDNQITVIEDDSPREFLGWAGPGANKFSVTNTYIGKFLRKGFRFNTDTNGSHRAIVPIGVYESVMPLDIQPTYLIKALASNDIEAAEKLGALELVEEDLALCEFVCPSKTAITKMLREMLTRLEKEG